MYVVHAWCISSEISSNKLAAPIIDLYHRHLYEDGRTVSSIKTSVKFSVLTGSMSLLFYKITLSNVAILLILWCSLKQGQGCFVS